MKVKTQARISPAKRENGNDYEEERQKPAR
jgi:hypothetical protein